MNYKNLAVFLDRVFTPKFCDDIVNHYKQKNKIAGSISNGVNKDIRDSNIVFDSEARFIFKETNLVIADINKKAGWNFQIDYPETFQFTEYKLNQHYHWHVDAHPEKYPNNCKDVFLNNKIRKISMSICLSDKEDYEGGDFLLDFRNSENEHNVSNFVYNDCLRNKGSAVIFPSYIFHTVKPVTSGTRHSGVLWYVGNPYV
jgi:PKHD-type hydroxylase